MTRRKSSPSQLGVRADLSELTPLQAALLAAVCAGKSVAAAAESIGMPIRTARRYAGAGAFRACLGAARREHMSSATALLASLTTESITTMATLMRDEKCAKQTRLQAARSIIDAATTFILNEDTEAALEKVRAKRDGRVLDDDDHPPAHDGEHDRAGALQ